MSTSDIISIIAVSVSFISIIATIIIYSNQKKYISTQNELNKLLLNKEKMRLNPRMKQMFPLM